MFARISPMICVSGRKTYALYVFGTNLTNVGIEEVATWTADLSGKTLEKDFERINTPQGTFYRACFDIYLNFDGFGFNAELVCSGEAMGRRWVRFR